MADFPCENPNCNSFGKPHPNCKCTPNMAEGGAVEASMFDDMKADVSPEGEKPLMFDDLKEDASPEGEKPLMFDDLKSDYQGDEANNDLSPADLQKKMVEAANPQGASSYESPGQQLATVAEGAAQGLAGPLAPLAETKLLGVPAEDIVARAEANPIEHGLAETGAFVGSMATGLGEAGLIAKAGELGVKGANVLKGINGLGKMGRVGTGAIKGGIEAGLIRGSNEASKAILGQASPEHAVNPYLAMGATVLFGMGLGGFGSSIAEKAAAKLPEEALKRDLFVSGAGMAQKGMALPEGSPEALAAGHNFFSDMTGDAIVQKASKGVAKSIAGKIALPVRAVPVIGRKIANKVEDVAGDLGGSAGNILLKPFLGKPIDKINQFTAPTVLRWLQSGSRASLYNMIDYANKVDRGTSLINNSIDALFKSGAARIPDAVDSAVSKLRDYQDDGGIDNDLQAEVTGQHDTQAFAEGGHVNKKAGGVHDTHDHIAQVMPEQNLLIQAAKGRISKYLSSQRPQQHQPKLAFDDEPDDRQQKKRYDNALRVAAHPIGVLGHIQKGTIEPEHIEHLNAMYPDLTQHLQQKITERIVTDQLDGKKPSYKIRQGLSMLMGTPLSGEITPQNIQAAQAVFRSGEKPPASGSDSAAVGAKTKSPSALSKSDRSYLTDDQARQSRQQRSS